MRVDRRRLLLLAAAPVVGLGHRVLAQSIAPAAPSPDPLPSWNDGAVKKSIADFVARVTMHDSPDFVPIDQRIATFDNDGTLWCEQPIYIQVAFAFDEVKRLAPQHPEWKKQQPFKDLLEGKMQLVADAGEKSLLEIIMATHSGMSVDDFSKIVLDWITTAQHPRFKRPYIELVYQPMQELMRYLRGNDFKTFIVSGGGIEFMRPWTEKVYGIPPEQVVGSSGATKWQMNPGGKPVLMKLPKVEFVDDGPASRSASTGSSAAVRSSPSAIPTAISRCWNGRRRAPARASWGLCITPMPSANMPMTANRKWAGSTRRSMKPMPRAGRWPT